MKQSSYYECFGVGVQVSLSVALFNHCSQRPYIETGEAAFVEAEHIYANPSGDTTGCMASSDKVLRAAVSREESLQRCILSRKRVSANCSKESIVLVPLTWSSPFPTKVWDDQLLYSLPDLQALLPSSKKRVHTNASTYKSAKQRSTKLAP